MCKLSTAIYENVLTVFVVHQAGPLKVCAVVASLHFVVAIVQHRAGVGARVVGDPEAVLVAVSQAQRTALVHGGNVLGALVGPKAAVACLPEEAKEWILE